MKESQLDKIQRISVEAGEVFAEIYREGHDAQRTLDALEAYKFLRRLLPLEEEIPCMTQRHIGATAAHAATQGDERV